MTDLVHDMLPTAAALSVAVHDRDQQAVAATLTPLSTRELHALAILFAAHVDVDEALFDLPSPTAILQASVRHAAAAFHTTEADILGTSRIRNVLDARAVAMTAARWCGLTSTEIGRHFGKDHTTVLYAATRVGETPRLRTAAGAIANRLGRDSLADEDAAA